MVVHTELTPAEAADRLALRELFDAYAHCADRRDAEGQKALFTADTRELRNRIQGNLAVDSQCLRRGLDDRAAVLLGISSSRLGLRHGTSLDRCKWGTPRLVS